MSHFLFVAENQPSAYNRRTHRTKSVERLRHVETRGCRLARAEFGDIRICRRFEKCQSATDHEQREQEKLKRHQPFARNKQQRANAIEQQTDNHASPVSPTADKQSGRDGHREIARIEHHLHQRRPRLCHLKHLLEMLVENIKDCVGETPHEKQRRYQDKRCQIFLFDQCFLHFFLL